MSQKRCVAVLGAKGQVGSALCTLLGTRAAGLARVEADLAYPRELTDVLERLQPEAVINAAAYTAVDKAESERDLAFAINAEAPGVLARWCAEQGIPFVHYSTDYVFDGKGVHFHTEEEKTAPLGVYGASKLAGEQEVQKAGGKYLIFRTSWVYDAWGKNFFNTMLRLAGEREQLFIVNDQTGAPTYAPHLASLSWQALEKALAMPQFPAGVYHLCNSGVATWYAFASAIFEAVRAGGAALKVRDVQPIHTEDYPTPAERPKNSRLAMEKFGRAFGLAMPPWQEGLKEAVKAKGKL